MLDIKILISSLTELDLLDSKLLNEDDIRSQYRKLTKVYHPDVSPSMFKDGKKFVKIQDAAEYLISNLEEVNRYLSQGILNSFNQTGQNHSAYSGYNYYSNTNRNQSSPLR